MSELSFELHSMYRSHEALQRLCSPIWVVTQGTERKVFRKGITWEINVGNWAILEAGRQGEVKDITEVHAHVCYIGKWR